MTRKNRRRLNPIQNRRPVELLEQRRLLCSLPHLDTGVDFAPQYVRPATEGGPEVDTGGIVWSNRGTTDNFGVTFGGQANNARQVVDAAFYFWNQVVSSINQTGGNSQIDISVTANARGTGQGGGGGVDTLLGDKPRTGSITIGGGSDRNGNGSVADGEGYYIDLTPYEYTEFQGNIVNAATGEATPGSAAANDGNDLFSLITIEIQHALGIDDRYANLRWRSDPNDYLRPAGTSHATAANDTADTPGKLYYLNAPGVQALYTSNNGGAGGEDRGYAVHSARPGQSYTTGGVTYVGQTDTGTTGYPAGRRYLPSYVAVQTFATMYGYTVNPPQDVSQTFYAVPDRANRRVLVRNTDPTSSDVMQIRSGSGFFFIDIDIGNDVAGTNTNGLNVYQFNKLAFDTVIADGGGGTDFIRLETNDGSSVTLRGGAGDDFIDFSFLARNLNNITGSAFVEGGSGFDQVFIYDNNQPAVTALTITSAVFSRPGWAGFSYASDTENHVLTTGTAADTVNVPSTFTNQPIVLNSAGGADIVNIGNSTNGVRSINATVEVNNTPSFSVVNINNAADTIARSVFAQSNGAFGIIGGLAPFLISYRYADVSAVNVTLGSGSDTVSILQAAKPLNFTCSNGFQQNTFTLGNSSQGTGGITANLRILAFGFAGNDIIVDNFGGANRTGTLAAAAPGEFALSGFTGAGTVTYNRQAFNSGESLTILGGFGDESLSVNNVIHSGAVTFDGRGGFDSMVVDDRLQANVPTTSNFSATGIVRTSGTFPVITLFSTFYANLDSLTYFAHPSATTTNITGVPSSIPAGQQATIFLGNNVDTVNLYPHDANGNLTINGNIGVVGGNGSDIMRVQDAASSNAINYSFSNPFGAGTQNVYGLGTAGLGTATIETWEVYGGTGNDTFAMNQFTSGIALGIDAGGGDDTLQFGNNGLGAITNLASFNFSGGAGYDVFNLNNQTHTGTWTYTRNAGSITASSTLGASYFLSDFFTELMRLNGGPSGETFNINAVATGSAVEANGAGGVDIARLTPSSNNGESIQGRVDYSAGANGGNAVLFDQFDTTGDTFHLTQTSLGAFPGDNLFGPGGLFNFAGLTDVNIIAPALTVHLGSGSDIGYLQPLASGTATVNFNAQNFSDASQGAGDGVNLALAEAVNYLITDPGTGSGNVVSDTTGRLNWNDVELPVQVDDVAPAALSGEFQFDVPQQAVAFTISEDVSQTLTTSSVIITNVDTGVELSQGVMSLAYDAANNIATVTFPGFPNGALPDGNYRVVLALGYTDLFGNAAAAPLAFDTFAFAGDADHDRTIDISDFAALAANFNSGTTFSQGDFDYSGLTDIGDFAILAAKFNQSLPAARAGVQALNPFAALNRLIGDEGGEEESDSALPG